MINPEEKNCVVTNGNATIPVSWWVFQPVQHRHSPSLWLRPQCCSVWPLLPEDGLPHFLCMHKHSLSRQEALIRNILSISSHGINTNRGLLSIWPIFQMSSRRAASVAEQWNNVLNSSIVGCFLASSAEYSGPGKERGNRRRLLVARHGWHCAHVSAPPPPPPNPHPPFPDPDP